MYRRASASTGREAKYLAMFYKPTDLLTYIYLQIETAFPAEFEHLQLNGSKVRSLRFGTEKIHLGF